MTNIVVLIKQVPDTWSERKLTDGDFTLDREAADAVLDEINERAVEEALLIKEREGGESTITVLTAGPERATEAIRKALSMGADKAVHLKDDAMHGSDVVQTAWALARALGDDSLEVVFWVPERGTYVDGTGTPVTLPADGARRAAVEVDLAGRRVGAIVYDAGVIGEHAMVRSAGRVMALALDRERLTAALRAGEPPRRRPERGEQQDQPDHQDRPREPPAARHSRPPIGCYGPGPPSGTTAGPPARTRGP